MKSPAKKTRPALVATPKQQPTPDTGLEKLRQVEIRAARVSYEMLEKRGSLEDWLILSRFLELALDKGGVAQELANIIHFAGQ